MKYKPNYKLLLGLPLIVIAFGALTILVLSKFVPLNKSASTGSTVINLGPADIIKKYQTAGAVSGLSNLYNKTDTALIGMNVIAYTADNSYTIYETPTDFVQFEQKDKTTANSASVKADSEAFMKRNNFKKTPTNTNKASTLATIFESSRTVCQLVDLPPFDGAGAILSFSCIKKISLDNQYSEINKLLALYGDRKPTISNPENIRTNTISDSNKTLSTIDIYGIGSNKGAVTLVFAAIDGNWAYLGQRTLSASTREASSGVVDGSMSDDLKTNIKDPKYGDFLKQYIQ